MLLSNAYFCFSVNPRLDVGQIEGAFVQGMGYWLSEKVVNDEESGEQLTIGTWVSKIGHQLRFSVVALSFSTLALALVLVSLN